MANGKDTGIVNIHGKEYQTVAYRVGKFREIHGLDLSLTTEIVTRDEDCVVMKATITNEGGRVLATGHSEEYRQSSTINRTSALENAETSAIGRALAALGLGGTEFATADEVAKALQKQSRITPNADAGKDLTNGKKQRCADIAVEVKDFLKEGKEWDAYQALETAKLDMEEKLYIWTLFQSHERAAIKRMQAAENGAGKHLETT